MKTLDTDMPQLSDLRVVLALIEDGTVTKAAVRLGVTQSALSYQVERMRKRFGDPLFVRVGNRMAATPFALRVAEPASRVLRIMEAEIGGIKSFDPLETRREFRIGMNELGALTLLPRLVKRLAELAPNARLMPVPVNAVNLSQLLESGDIDTAAGFFATSDTRLFQQRLYQRDYACVARRDHPSIGQSLSWREFGRAPKVHLGATPSTTTWLESQLRKGGHSLTVHMTSQYIAAIPFIVAASDLIAVIPRELYELFLPISAIKVVRLPKVIPAITIRQYWHPRLAGDPSIRFLRELVYAVAREPAIAA
ncbi:MULTISPECIES: LysR family transcriptional regulator [Polaromonas]|uniref:LysR family transcriptional regulator n=1 Tax=Polaromonas aquatica TaxID=332657 RepID=A0ABW1U532_9BURK